MPSNPRLVGRNEGLRNGVALALTTNRAYTVHGTGGLRIVDLSNSTNLVVIGTNSAYNAMSVAVSGNYAYLGDAGLRVVDISDPMNPQTVTNISGTPRTIALSGSHTYAGSVILDPMRTIEVSDPFNPQWVGSIRTNFVANRISVSGNHAFLSDGTDGGYRWLMLATPASAASES